MIAASFSPIKNQWLGKQIRTQLEEKKNADPEGILLFMIYTYDCTAPPPQVLLHSTDHRDVAAPSQAFELGGRTTQQQLVQKRGYRVIKYLY